MKISPGRPQHPPALHRLPRPAPRPVREARQPDQSRTRRKFLVTESSSEDSASGGLLVTESSSEDSSWRRGTAAHPRPARRPESPSRSSRGLRLGSDRFLHLSVSRGRQAGRDHQERSAPGAFWFANSFPLSLSCRSVAFDRRGWQEAGLHLLGANSVQEKAGGDRCGLSGAPKEESNHTPNRKAGNQVTLNRLTFNHCCHQHAHLYFLCAASLTVTRRRSASLSPPRRPTLLPSRMLEIPQGLPRSLRWSRTQKNLPLGPGRRPLRPLRRSF